MHVTRTRVTGLLALAAIGGATVVAAAPASANYGYPICVVANTHVRDEPTPTGNVRYTMSTSQAFHVYDVQGGWATGYVSRTNPVVRGWVPMADQDTSRPPYPTADGGDAC